MNISISKYYKYLFVQFDEEVEKGTIYIVNNLGQTTHRKTIKNKNFAIIKLHKEIKQNTLIIKNKANEIIYQDKIS